MRGKRNLNKVGDEVGNFKIEKIWTEKFPNHKSKESVWECLCKCGNRTVVRARYVRNSHTNSCGCLTKRINKENPCWKGHGEISASQWANIKGGAKRRGRQIEFFITIEQAWDLFLKQNRKCKLTGEELIFPERCRRYNKYVINEGTASLDRIESDKGYTIDNVQWVHKDVNLMKMALPQDKFLEWCNKISKYNTVEYY